LAPEGTQTLKDPDGLFVPLVTKESLRKTHIGVAQALLKLAEFVGAPACIGKPCKKVVRLTCEIIKKLPSGAAKVKVPGDEMTARTCRRSLLELLDLMKSSNLSGAIDKVRYVTMMMSRHKTRIENSNTVLVAPPLPKGFKKRKLTPELIHILSDAIVGIGDQGKGDRELSSSEMWTYLGKTIYKPFVVWITRDRIIDGNRTNKFKSLDADKGGSLGEGELFAAISEYLVEVYKDDHKLFEV